MMGFFKGGALSALKNRLGEDRHEGIEDDGQTGFFHALHQNLFEVDRINEQELRRYDLNIIQHWNAITERRNKVEGTLLKVYHFEIDSEEEESNGWQRWNPIAIWRNGKAVWIPPDEIVAPEV